MVFQKGHKFYGNLSKSNYFQKGHTPWNKGKHTGIIPKNAFKKGQTSAFKGKHHTEENRIKIGKNHKGQIAWNKGKRLPQFSGKKIHQWKGDSVGYDALHDWVKRWKGKAIICEHCGKEWNRPKSIGWANIDHKYRRNLDDFISLCGSCHKKYDFKNN